MERSRLRKGLGALGALVVMVTITLAMLEAALRLAQWRGFFQSQERLVEPVSFYQDRDPVYGIWHPPEARYVARADCFEVVYESNSFGARDRERSLQSSEPRVAVLGDSFVEGIGMLPEQRMTDLLESRVGIEFLNFGTAGNFSSTQQWLQYRELVSRFDHDLVLLFAFPNNDFLENDPERFWQRDRYRPYLRRADPAQGEEPAWQLFYPVGFEEAQRRAERQLWWNRWYNRLFVYRFASWLDGQVRVRLAQGDTSEFGYIGYVDVTEEDLARLVYTYRALRDEAAGRELVIFTIPRLNDLLYHRAKGYPSKLPDRLKAFAEAEPRIRYADLMPGFVSHAERTGTEFEDYFIPCDGHWSALGNEVAAALVLETLGWGGSGDAKPALARARAARQGRTGSG